MSSAPVTKLVPVGKTRDKIEASFRLSNSATKAKPAIRLAPEAGSNDQPFVCASMEGGTVHVETFEQEGESRWYSIDVRPGAHHVMVSFGVNKGIWKGSARLWLVGNRRLELRTIRCELLDPPHQRPMPPLAGPKGEVRNSVPVGRVDVELDVMR